MKDNNDSQNRFALNFSPEPKLRVLSLPDLWHVCTHSKLANETVDDYSN